MDMYKYLKMLLSPLSHKSRYRRLLAGFIIFTAFCMSAQAANITWTGSALDNDWNNAANWNPQSVPGENDTVIFNGAATITVTNDITITNLHIYSGTNIVTLDFSGTPANHSLTIKTRLRLGNGPTGHLVLVNANVQTKEFDTNDNGVNSLKLNGTTFTLTGNSATDRGKLLKNGSGTTTISADSPATGHFIITDTVDIPDNYNGTNYYSGVTLVFDSSITVTSPINIWTGRTDSDWNTAGNWLFGIPGDDSEVVIPDITPAPELSSASAELKSITIDTNAKFTLSPGGTLSTAKATNNGAITIKGGSITGTSSTASPAFANGSDSSIIYDGATTPVWDDTYNNLEIKSGSLTFSDDTSVNGLLKISSDVTNNAIITVKADVTSTADISGSGKLLFTGNSVQTFSAGNNTYTNIEENKNGGSLSVSGSCTIDSFTITKGSATAFSDSPVFTSLTITNGGSTSFTGTPEITNWSDVSGAGNLSFSAGANFNTDTEIKTSGTVSMEGSFSTADLTVTNGAASLNGSFNSDSITFTKPVTLAGNTTITSSTSSENVLFGDAITGGANSLTINTGATQFDGVLSGLSALTTDAVTINCTSITSSGLQSFNGEITLGKNTSLTASEIDFADAISGSGYTLTIHTDALQNTAASGSKTISLTELILDSDVEIKTQNGTSINLDLAKISGTSSGKTFSLTGTGSTLTFAGNTSFETNVSTATGTTFTASGTMTFSADATFADGTITATSGTMIFDAAKKSGSPAVLSGNNTFNNLTFSGPVNLTGSNTINGTLLLTGTDSVSISGSNTIHTLIAGTSAAGDGLGGKTITIGAGKKQTVTNSLSLYGTSTTSKLTLTSVGEWEIEYNGSSTLDLKFISVKNSKNLSTDSFIALSSSDNGGNTKWIFPGQIYIWQGGTAGYLTDWDTAGNWEPQSIPGSGAEITIPAGKTYYPVLTRNIDLDDTDASTNYGNIINNGTLDLSSFNLKLYSITNNGLLRAKGVTNQKIEGTVSNGTNTASTVEYYDSGNNNFFWDGNNNSADGKQYTNLILNQTVTSADDFVISRNLTIQNSVTLSGKISATGTTTISGGADKTVSLSNNTNTFTGNIIAGKSTNPSPFNAGTLTINAGSQITLANNANAKEITVDCPVKIQNVTTSGNQTYNSTVETITAAAAIKSSSGSISFGNTFTSGQQTSISAVSGQQILFNGSVTGSAKLTTSGDATAVFTGEVSALAALETNAARINCSTLSTTGNQTYNGAVTVTAAGGSSAASTSGSINFYSTLDVDENLNLSASGTNGKIIFDAGSSVTGDSTLSLSTGSAATNSISFNGYVGSSTNYLEGLSIGTAYSTSFANPVYITSFSDTRGSGNISFQQGGTIAAVNGQTFNTSGKVTFGDDSSDEIYIGTASPYRNLTHTAGETALSGSIYAADFSVGKFSAAGSVITTGQQTYNGAVTLTGDLSLKSDEANPLAIVFTAAAGIDGAYNLSTQSPGGTVFNANVGTAEAVPLTSITVNGPAAINCKSIKSSGPQQYVGAVTLGTTPSLTHTVTGTRLTFDSTIDGAARLIVNGSEKTIFNNKVGFTSPLSSLESQGPLEINCSGIKTSGTQNYDKTVALLAASVTLTAQTTAPANSTVTFKGNVTGTSAASTSLTINADTIISADTSEIKTNGNQTYNGTTTINNPAAITSTAGSLNYTGLITLNEDAVFSAEATSQIIDFAGNITDNGNSKTLTVSTSTLQNSTAAPGPAEIKLKEFKISRDMTIGSVNDSALTLNVNTITGNSELTFGINTTSFTLKDGIIINPPVIIQADRTAACAGAATFNSSVTNNGSLLGDTSAAKNLIFEQKYQGTNGYLTASAGNTVFKADSDLSGTSFIHSNGTANFAGNGTAQTLKTQTDGSTEFYNVSITSPAKVETTSSFKVNGINWENTSPADGFMASSPSAITFNNSTAPVSTPATVNGKNIFYDVICNTEAQNITFENTNTFTNLVTIGNRKATPAPVKTGTVTIGSSSELTFAEDLYCNIFNLDNGANTVTFTGDSEFTSKFENNGTAPLIFSGDTIYGKTFINNSTELTSFYKGFTGGKNASFDGDIELTGDSNRSFSAGTGYKITCSKNLIVDTDSANTIQINTDLSSGIQAANFVLYSGKVTLNGSLESTGDLILLGPDYATKDPQTGIEGIYLYNQDRPSALNYSPDFRAAPYNGAITALEDSVMKAGKNFYSNGISLQGPASGQWKLLLSKTSDAENGFAEAVKTTVNNCAVGCHEEPSNTVTDNSAPAKVAAYECTDNSNNTNWNFEDFEITAAWTERDNAVYVEFNAPVRNLHDEFNSSLSYLTYKGTSASRTAFTGIYSAPDCQAADSISNTDIELTDGKYKLYLKAPDSWNTDARGNTAGQTKSSDRYGNHKASVPYLDLPRSLTAAAAGTASNVNYIITNKWGKRLNNYSSRTPTAGYSYGTNETSGSETYVLDKTGPVLWSARTGQELHSAYNTATGEASQHSYDSHNFLEFRYSEPVSFGSADTTVCDVSIPAYSSGTTVNLTENIQVTDRFGAISGNITAAADTLTFTGLARLEAPAAGELQLYTGMQGSANKYMNALYRTDEYSVRLSVAGWTDGTVSDYRGNAYKKWAGYIEQATQFTGAQAFPVSTTNALVKDQSGNPQIEYEANKVEPVVKSNSTEGDPSHLLPVSPDVYSTWDLSEPVFTPLRFSAETEWGNMEMSEAIGNTNGSGSTLDRIDFHFFDNTPSYNSSDAAEWFTEIGWCVPGSQSAKENLKDYSYTYCADIIGGARQFDTNAARRTTGGIRFSTKAGIAPAFKYSTSPNNPSPSTSFINDAANTHSTIISQLFTGSSTPMRPANDPDGLYLGLGLTDTNLSVETTFAFSYNESQGYLTDLAGNRLRTTLSKTIDRTPPSFDIIFSPVDSKSVYIVFVKEIVTNSRNLRLRTSSDPNDSIDIEPFETLMPKCFRIISIDSSGNSISSNDIQIDTTIPAQIISDFTNSSFTCIKLTTTSDITIDNLENLYVQLIMPDEYPSTSIDPFTSNNNSRVTLIQDKIGNYMSMYCAHALSDFAINYVNPLYAYSSDMLDAEKSVMDGLYEEGSWAVHDWNADQQNYGTLPAEHPVSIVADTKSNPNIRLYLSPSPDSESVSKQFNYDFNTKLRVWLPSLTDGIFRALSANNNSNFVYEDGEDMEDSPENLIFNLSKETVSAWQSGTQISFMFGLMDDAGNPVRIYNNPYFDIETDRFNLTLSIPVPLYSLRMKDISNPNSLDLWSFKIKGTKHQRGGVTILNNVINAANDEKTVIKVELPEAGKLNVIVMTLDGNIITYLNRGETKAGEHYFTWNGKNKKGNSVARGMYFVRVIGSGIDETRKVMVVK